MKKNILEFITLIIILVMIIFICITMTILITKIKENQNFIQKHELNEIVQEDNKKNTKRPKIIKNQKIYEKEKGKIESIRGRLNKISNCTEKFKKEGIFQVFKSNFSGEKGEITTVSLSGTKVYAFISKKKRLHQSFRLQKIGENRMEISVTEMPVRYKKEFQAELEVLMEELALANSAVNSIYGTEKCRQQFDALFSKTN